MAKQFRFNLLAKKGGNLFEETASFFNNYARYIIILTQLVVLVVFFIKIILDQTVIDLKEAIDQKNQIILSSQEMINNSNALADKTRDLTVLIDTIEKQHAKIYTTLKNVPKTIILDKIELVNNRFVIVGHTFEPTDIQKLQVRLSKKTGSNVSIERISKEHNVYNFEIYILDET